MVYIRTAATLALATGILARGVPQSRSLSSLHAPSFIDDQLQELISTYNIPALGVAVDDGSTVAYGQSGVRKIGTDELVSANTVWHLGSNTKSMTATIISLLVQEGLLTWDSTINDIFVDKFPKINDNVRDVTLKELTSHRSGISGTFSLEPALPAYMQLSIYAMDVVPARAVAVSNIIGDSPLGMQANGTRGAYEYSNNNYILLGHVIDVITGKPAEEVIKSKIWEPLGLSSASWDPLPPNSPWPHLPNLTTLEPYPYPEAWPVELRDLPPALNPAGLAHMTTEDYNKWLRVHVDPATQKLIGLESEQLTILHTAPPILNPTERTYTYGGWARYEGEACSNSTNPGYCLFHTGSNLMNIAQGWVDTTRNLTVSAMANCPPAIGGAGATMAALGLLRSDNLVL